MPVPPDLAEQKRLRSHPSNCSTLAKLRLIQILAAADHSRRDSISKTDSVSETSSNKWRLWNSSVVVTSIQTACSFMFGTKF